MSPDKTLTEFAHAKGSSFPPLNKDVLRLYSMRFCPYAQRTRIVLAHKHIPHEVVNVNLADKPGWFLERNPLGKTPILEENDKIVYESAICNQYLDDVYPQNRLMPADPYQRARLEILAEIFNQLLSMVYKMRRLEKLEDKKTVLAELQEKYASRLEQELQGKYFGGDDLNMLDVHIWPFFERFGTLFEEPELNPIDGSKFPKLAAYIEDMKKHPTISQTLNDLDILHEFEKSKKAGSPLFDIGLNKSED